MSIRGLRGRVNVDDNQTKDVTVTENGTKVALDVNVVSGGGGGAGDASAANQTTQITEAQSTNTKLDSLIAQTDQVETLLGNIDSNTSGGSGGDASAANQTTQISRLEDIRDSQTVNVPWDYYDITYVAAGNGAGEVETQTFFTGPVGSGTQVLQLTYTYDAQNRVTRVERS